MRAPASLLAASKCCWLSPRRCARRRLIRRRQPLHGPGGRGPAAAAGARLQARYRHWRNRLERHGVSTGATSSGAARPTTGRRPRSRAAPLDPAMSARFANWSHDLRGPATVLRARCATSPAGARSTCAPSRWCESHDNPRAVGGGGAYRGMYQFSLLHWRGRRSGRPRRRAALGADLAGLGAAETARLRPLARLRLAAGVPPSDKRRARGDLARARRRAVTPPALAVRAGLLVLLVAHDVAVLVALEAALALGFGRRPCARSARRSGRPSAPSCEAVGGHARLGRAPVVALLGLSGSASGSIFAASMWRSRASRCCSSALPRARAPRPPGGGPPRPARRPPRASCPPARCRPPPRGESRAPRRGLPRACAGGPPCSRSAQPPAVSGRRR